MKRDETLGDRVTALNDVPAPPLSPPEVFVPAADLTREELLREVRAALCLGAVAWAAALGALSRRGAAVPRPRPAFRHGAELRLAGAPALVASYHVSRQNTQTGRLTPGMFDAVLARALALAARG
jgi:uracil-DNA glycosylase